jgi:hypothetical protein
VIDIFWRPLGAAVQREGLAMLDGSGNLITYPAKSRQQLRRAA